MAETKDEEEHECRICRGSAEPNRPLFYPCKCSGSIKYTHEDCLIQWLKQARSEKCELCHHNFRFEPMYKSDTPQSLPFSELVSGVLARIRAATKVTARISLVVLVWLFTLPLLTCWTWHSLFARSVYQFARVQIKRGIFGVFQDVMQGHLLSLTIIVFFFGVSSLREHVQNPNEAGGQREDANEEVDSEEEEILDDIAVMARTEGDESLLRDLQQVASQYEERDGRLVRRRGAGQAHATERFRGIDPGHTLENAADLEQTAPDVEETRDIEALHLMTAKRTGLRRTHVRRDEREDDIDSTAATVGSRDEDEIEVNPEVNSDVNPEDTLSEGSMTVASSMSVETGGSLHDGGAAFQAPATLPEAENGRIQRRVGAFRNEVDAVARGEHREPEVNDGRRERNGDGAPLFGLFDLDPEDVPLEEVIGLKGPIRNLFENSGTALFSNIMFLIVFTFVPLITGRVTLRVLSLITSSVQWMTGSNGTSFPALQLNDSTFGKLMMSLHSGHFAMPTPDTNLSVRIIANVSSTGLNEQSPMVSVGKSIVAAPQQIPIGNLFTVLFGYGIISLACVSYVLVTSALKPRYLRLDPPAVQYLFRFVRCVATFAKVVLLILFEFGVFPLGCGWWLDVCTLSFVGATYESRMQFLRLAPWTSTLLHWLIGLLYMVSISLFVSVLRELIQPSLLWFLRNPEDPDFQPFRELIHKPLSRHARRMVLSMMLYGPFIYLLVHVPCRICMALFPTLSPFNVHFVDPLTEIPADLFLLHFCIPLTAMVHHVKPRAFVTRAMKLWIRHVSLALGIHHLVARDPAEIHENRSGVDDDDEEFEEDAPPYAKLRGLVMLVLAWMTMVAIGLVSAIVPTFIGRVSLKALGLSCSHDIYTFGIGAYEILFLTEGILHLVSFLRNHELRSALRVMVRCVTALAKVLVLMFMWLFVVPLMIGVLIDLTVIAPQRVATDESVNLFFYQDWAMGMMLMKFPMRFALAGGRSLRERWNAIRAGGFRVLDREFVDLARNFLGPLILKLGCILSVPIIISRSILPLTGMREEYLDVAERYAYLATALGWFQILAIVYFKKALVRLHNRIRDDKYLVGKRLYNFGVTEDRKNSSSNSEERTIRNT